MTLGGGDGGVLVLLKTPHFVISVPPPPDPDGRGLECSDVPWDRVTGGRSAWNVLLDLLHRPDPLWKLYPLSLSLIDPDQLTFTAVKLHVIQSYTTVKSSIVDL